MKISLQEFEKLAELVEAHKPKEVYIYSGRLAGVAERVTLATIDTEHESLSLTRKIIRDKEYNETGRSLILTRETKEEITVIPQDSI